MKQEIGTDAESLAETVLMVEGSLLPVTSEASNSPSCTPGTLRVSAPVLPAILSADNLRALKLTQY